MGRHKRFSSGFAQAGSRPGFQKKHHPVVAHCSIKQALRVSDSAAFADRPHDDLSICYIFYSFKRKSFVRKSNFLSKNRPAP